MAIAPESPTSIFNRWKWTSDPSMRLRSRSNSPLSAQVVQRIGTMGIVGADRRFNRVRVGGRLGKFSPVGLYSHTRIKGDPRIMAKRPERLPAAVPTGQFQLGNMQGSRVRAFQRRTEQAKEELNKKKLQRVVPSGRTQQQASVVSRAGR